MPKFHQGWAGPELELPAFEAYASQSHNPVLNMDMINWDEAAKYFGTGDSDPKGKRHAFWDSVIKLTGKHLPNTNQLLGDCVGAGTEMELEYMLADQIVREGRLELYRPIFRPFLYGAGRVLIGKNRIRGDGSIMSWQMEAIQKIGILAEDEPGIPTYSTAVGREWGSSAAILNKWVPLAKDQRIEKYVDVRDFDDLAKCVIIAKMGVVIASSQGFEMQLRHDSAAGCSWYIPSGVWQHLQHIPAVDYNLANPRCYVGNQWGYNAHPGQLDGPNGGGWLRPEQFDRWIKKSGTVCCAMINISAWRKLAPNFNMI